jgi:GTP pyrophosphokinase
VSASRPVSPPPSAAPADLLARVEARLGNGSDSASRRACEVLTVLRPLHPDPRAMLAAALHLQPALRQALTESELAPLAALEDGLLAAERIDALHASQGEGAKAEGLRRLLLAIVRELALVPALLAIRLVALRHAGELPDAQRRAQARLVEAIYAPLANRLGVWQLKWELEDLVLRILDPAAYQRIADLLDEKRPQRERYIDNARAQLADALREAGITAEVAGRPKHIASIHRKMQRKQLPFDGLYDLRALRVLVDDVPACYAALGVLHQLWLPIPGEFDDYIAKPKGNDYRSLHSAVVGPDGLALEVQIRTRAMHEYAELGVAAHWRYKEGGHGDALFERKIAWMRQLLAQEGEQSLLGDFGAGVLEDRVYLLTPRGEVIDLTQGATVLDFAYAIHTEVGHRCRGAKVNDRIVPLDYQPATGDRIEILTGKQAAPRRDWLQASLGYLRTGRARDKIRAWFQRLDRERNVEDGRALLERELRKLSLGKPDLKPVLEKLRLGSVDELLVALALGDVGPNQVGRILHEAVQPRIEPAARPVGPQGKPRGGEGSGLTVQGVGNLLVQMARCCQPLPGDAITGYLSRVRGVTVHRQDCVALARLLAQRPERAMAVEWGRAGGQRYTVDLQVLAIDRPKLLKDLSNAVAQLEVPVLAMDSRVDEGSGRASLRLRVRIADFDELSRLLDRLQAVPSVSEARRVG